MSKNVSRTTWSHVDLGTSFRIGVTVTQIRHIFKFHDHKEAPFWKVLSCFSDKVYEKAKINTLNGGISHFIDYKWKSKHLMKAKQYSPNKKYFGVHCQGRIFKKSGWGPILLIFTWLGQVFRSLFYENCAYDC